MKAHSNPRTAPAADPRRDRHLVRRRQHAGAGIEPPRAPAITGMPKVDATDFYMFNSYEGVAADGSGGRSAT
jgi:hypothetical protein